MEKREILKKMLKKRGVKTNEMSDLGGLNFDPKKFKKEMDKKKKKMGK